MYDPAKMPPLRPAGLPRKPNFYEAIRRTRRLDKMSDADFRKIQAVYLGMISYSDWMFGELMAIVKRMNPQMKRVGLPWNPSQSNSETYTKIARTAK